MSNALAIAMVTECIRNVLYNALVNDPDADLGDVEVVLKAPGSQNLPAKGVVLFLARITPSAAWRSVDLPTRGPDGQLIERPQVGLCLHYLLAMRGDEQLYEPHRIAGVVARVLATKPVLSQEIITETLNNLPTNIRAILQGSNLAEAPNLVRITPEPMSTEELSKIWTAYPQASQGPWLAYEVTTVVLDTKDAIGPALPVRERNLYVTAMSQARIKGLAPTANPEAPITAGSEVDITGDNLAQGEAVGVYFDGDKDPLLPDFAHISPRVVTVTLPATLLAGAHGVRVARMATLGTDLRRIAESNLFVFTVSPVINGAIEQSGMAFTTVGTTTFATGQLTIHCLPSVGQSQNFELLLNAPGDASRSYIFAASKRSSADPAESITVPIHDVPVGNYLVRIRVDGASSALVGGGTTAYSAPLLGLSP
jgi:Pvc16 N-terminal domain